jgi:hypothetical protein
MPNSVLQLPAVRPHFGSQQTASKISLLQAWPWPRRMPLERECISVQKCCNCYRSIQAVTEGAVALRRSSNGESCIMAALRHPLVAPSLQQSSNPTPQQQQAAFQNLPRTRGQFTDWLRKIRATVRLPRRCSTLSTPVPVGSFFPSGRWCQDR